MEEWKKDYMREYMKQYRAEHKEKTRAQDRKAAAAYRTRKKLSADFSDHKKEDPGTLE